MLQQHLFHSQPILTLEKLRIDTTSITDTWNWKMMLSIFDGIDTNNRFASNDTDAIGKDRFPFSTRPIQQTNPYAIDNEHRYRRSDHHSLPSFRRPMDIRCLICILKID